MKLLFFIGLVFIVGCGRMEKEKSAKEPQRPDLIVSKSICGSDDRKLSYDLRVARAMSSSMGGGCTATMISNNCAVSVGHCRHSLQVLEFNVPQTKDGVLQRSDLEDIYTMEKNSLVYEDEGIGRDWAVFRVNKNAYHGHSAGSMQGFYNLDFYTEVSSGLKIRITGYGIDDELDKTQSQQETTGEVSRVFQSMLFHKVDTMGGNSGSSIINLSNEMIIGVHSHGGCGLDANGGTLLKENKDFKEAVINCIVEDLYD